MNRFITIFIFSLFVGCGGDEIVTSAGGDTSLGDDVSAAQPLDAMVRADAVTPDNEAADAEVSSDVQVATEDAASDPPEDIGSVADTEAETQPEPDVVAEVDVPAPSDDVAVGPDAEATWPEGLHGTVPGAALPAPEFVALNSDGSARGPEDLMGKPTVMWFFPFAGTPG
ncbi:MAG: hypothetical protein ACPGU1_11410 [Myxococcota bacterium]